MSRWLLPLLAIVLISTAGCRSRPARAEVVYRPVSRADDVASQPLLPTPPTAVTPASAPPPEPEPSPESASAPDPEPPPPPPPVLLPVRVRIPSINVSARIIPVSTNRAGAMESPADAWSVGWYAPGFKPFEPGNAVLAGHVDFVRVGPAVFYGLTRLTPGDRVFVDAEDQQQYEFVVTELARYTPSNAPIDRIFGPNSNRGLVLITRGGAFNPRTRDYDQRIVVYTEALPPLSTADTPPDTG